MLEAGWTTRDKTKQVKVRGVAVGGGAPVSVQTMLYKRPDDVEGNVRQALEAEAAGCDIVRVAVPDQEAVRLIPAIREAVSIPLVADIHFDYRLALEAVAAGADKIRINPGNIGDDSRVKQVALACARANVPIRIGVNSGSVERHILAKYGSPSPEALVESALYHVELLHKFDFDQIIVSIKSSDVKTMVQACRLMARKVEYPLHLGVTEAGTLRMGLIRSSAGIGALLLDDIGDTLRVTLTDECAEEVRAGKDLLRGLGLLPGLQIISCPTCGRTTIDLFSLTKKVEGLLEGSTKPVKVAIMGCAVNGPGEARDADVGIAAGGGEALLFKKGEVVGKYPEDQILDALMEAIEAI